MPVFVPSDKQHVTTTGGGTFVPDHPAAPHPMKPTTHHHHSFFGDVGHFFKQGAVDLKNAAVSSPAGIAAVGDAAYRSIIKPPPLRSKEDTNALGDVASGLAHQVAADVRHPLRHPGNTALDLWAAASLGAGGVSRVAAAGRVARAGEGVGAVAKAALAPPKPPPIVMRASGFQAPKPASRAAMSRYVQTYVNFLRNRFPEAPIGLQSQVSRVGKALAAERKTQNIVLTNPAKLLISEGRRAGIKWDSPEGVAMRAVADGTPLDQRLAMHKADLARAKSTVAKKHLRVQIEATQKAIDRGLVRDGALADPKLAELYDRVKAAALAHDERLVQEGVMSPEGAAAAIQGPGRVFSGATFQSARTLTTPGAIEPRFPKGSLFHGSPEGELTTIDAYRHTKPWQEGIGFYVTDSHPKATQYAAGRTARGERLTAAKSRGAVNVVRLKPGARVLKMDAPADLPFWEKLSAGLDFNPDEFRRYVVDQAGLNPTNAKIREELLYQLQDMHGPEAIYSLEDALVHNGVQATSHMEGLKTGAPHRVWVVKDADVIEHVPKGQIKYVAGPSKTEHFPAGLYGAEGFAGGQFHVGYERYQKPGAVFKPPGMGSTKTIRVAKYAPPRLRKPLTGGNIHEGMFRNDVPHLVGENIIESERFLAVKRAARFFETHAADTPHGIKDGHAVAIATEELKHDPLPQQVKDFQAAQRAARHGPADRVAGLLYEDWRAKIFPDLPAADFEAHPYVKWIDERLLGDLNKPNPLVGMMQHKVARRGMTAFDQINNVSKFALLYLKPGYALPNIVGNTFLTLTHQGPMAVANLARASRLMVRAGREDGTLIDSLMGEGLTGSLATTAGGGERAVNYAAGKWGQIIDVPFRRAAFLYEARKMLGARPGKAAWPQIHDLLTNPARQAELHEVVTRANRAVIDYGTLNPVEQAIIRRILFFYPWLKGSTKYAGHYVTEHPVQAGAMGNLGQYGQQRIDETLGPLPSWAEGYFKVGGSDRLPLVVNPTAAGILGQPAQLGETLAAFLSGNHVPSAYQISNLLTPALAGANVVGAGYDPFTHKAVEPNIATWLSQQYQGLPLVTLIQRLQHDQSRKTFPLSKRDALLQFLLGSSAPKPADVQKLNRSAALDRLPPR